MSRRSWSRSPQPNRTIPRDRRRVVGLSRLGEGRLVVDDLGHGDDGIIHVQASLGYLETPDVPALLRQAAERSPELSAELADISNFLSTIELRVGDAPGITRLRKRLFVATSGITADAAEYFGLPRDRTVIMGSQIGV